MEERRVKFTLFDGKHIDLVRMQRTHYDILCDTLALDCDRLLKPKAHHKNTGFSGTLYEDIRPVNQSVGFHFRLIRLFDSCITHKEFHLLRR